MEVNQVHLTVNAQADLKLVEAAKAGSQKAYTELMNRYYHKVYFMVLKMVHNKDDATDITIETFGKAFEKLDKYQPIFAFSTWLFRVANNNSIDFLRKRKLQTVPIDEHTDEDDDYIFTLRNIKDTGLNPEEQSVNKQEMENVRTIIDHLPLRYRTIFVMRYFEELSYEEIADQLEMPMGTVKTRLFKCRDLLSQLVRGKMDVKR